MPGARWARPSAIGGLLFFGLVTLTGAAMAEGRPDAGGERPFSDPLLLRNDNPLYLTLSSTALADRARTVAPRHWAWEVGYLDSNTIIDQNNQAVTDRVIIDGEMYRFELDLKYGLAKHWELGAALPYLVFTGGYMDSFISDFESTFGFTTPRARRIRDGRNVRYLFRLSGQNLVDEQDKIIHGLGDIPMQLKYQFRDEPGGWLPRVAVRGLLKFPTATAPLLGNGRVDGGAGLLAEQPIGRRMLLIGHLDVTSTHLPLALKAVDLYPIQVSGMLGFEHFLTDRASWKAQITLASNPYSKFDKDMTALNTWPSGIALGWVYRLTPQAAVKLTVVENLDMAWPDFGWGASMEGSF